MIKVLQANFMYSFHEQIQKETFSSQYEKSYTHTPSVKNNLEKQRCNLAFPQSGSLSSAKNSKTMKII